MMKNATVKNHTICRRAFFIQNATHDEMAVRHENDDRR